MKRRLFSTFTVLLMICSLIMYLPGGIIVSADSFTPRTTAPSTSNSYYYSSNPFYQSGYGMPNCTCYAYGRAWELLGFKPNLSTGNAGKWYWYNKDNGIYPYGSTPKLGAIACWDKNDKNQGHVAVVEAINGDTVTISESHYKGTNFDTRNITSNSSNYLTSMRFCGYIYIKEFVPPPCNCSESYAGTYEVTTSQYPLTIRNGHGTGYSKIGEMPKGAHCTVTKANGTWAHVEYNGISGYASMEYLTKVGSKPSIVTPTISFDKSSYTVGDTVYVSWTPSPEGSNIENYWITINGPAGEVVNKDPGGTSYSFTANHAGTYTVTAYAAPLYSEHGEGSLSDTKEINVSDPIPEGAEMSAGAGRTIPDGDYVIVSELGMNLYLDIPGVSIPADNSSLINIWEGHPTKGSECDVWTITYLNNGYYKITQKGTSQALDVQGGSLKRGTKVIAYEFNNWKNQQWSINELDHGYQIQSRSTGYMLDVINGDSTPGNGVQVWQGNETKAQSWGFVPFANDSRPIEDGEYYIKSGAGNAWLDAAGDWNYKSETNIQVWDSKTDIFILKYVSDGYYRIYEKTSGLAIDIYNPDGDFLNRAENVQLFADKSSVSDHRGQLWRITEEGNGTYRLISKLSGYSLDLYGGVAERGKNVCQHTPNTTNAQKWSFEKVHYHNYTSKITKSATCTEDGIKTYTCECGDTYTEKIPATGHKWGTATYTWSADNKTSTATRVCANSSSHNETETVNTTYSVTKQPTCTDKGTGTYTATFKNTAFAKQTKNVDIAAKDHNWNAATYTWSSDYKTCTATRVCANDSTHKESETVNSTYSVTKQPTCTDKGTGTYTATFKNTAFTKQTKNVDVAAKGHNWNAATYTWSADNNDNKICTATRVCANDSTHKESETVNSTYSVTKEPTYTDKGLGTYTATFENNVFVKQTKNVELPPISPIPSSKVPELTATANEEKATLKWKPIANAEKYGIAGFVNGKWKLLDECYTISYELKNLKPGIDYKVAVVVMYDDKWNLDFSNAVTVALVEPTIPIISFEKGDNSVKLSWTSVRTAEKYGIFEYANEYWNIVGQTTNTSYVMNALAPGSKHKIAVAIYSGGKWNTDFSNAIVVTPKPDKYPKVTDTEYSERYHQFRLTWNAVDGATEYGIAVKLGGKWKIQAYTDKTNYTSPKLREGSTAEMVICAKVNGKWDISSINSRAFKVTVK